MLHDDLEELTVEKVFLAVCVWIDEVQDALRAFSMCVCVVYIGI